jgi:hypothetical protein
MRRRYFDYTGAYGQIRQGYSAAGLKFVTPGACNMDSPAKSLLAIRKSLVVVAADSLQILKSNSLQKKVGG